MDKPIELHSWNTPNGRKVSIALEEMDLAYAFHPVSLAKGEQKQATHAALNPNLKIPAIVDPDGPDGLPLTLFESGAILLYLARKSGLLGGKTKRERVEVEKWVFWQMGNLGPMAGQAEHFFDVAPRRQPPEAISYAQDRYVTEAGRLYGVLDALLAQRPYVAGDFFSVADIAIWPWITGWRVQGQNIALYPHLHEWLLRIGDRPGVRRGAMVGADLRKDIIMGGSVEVILFGHQPG